ncbi:toxin-antitoxin system YwqK family antitoxin [Quadrisphaera setariae]|uniref:toxin-antitoxin system YwqK family antitoxin n=1 Tax=Quadrisphaera setariae TaxID=2593304 RepID=UPI001C9BDC25|nr:hypothetical protein [Quadrisphaera setariae]
MAGLIGAEQFGDDGVHVEHHRDGSVRARGPVLDGKPEGYWEWYRLDGTKLRSGHFTDGEPVGEWATYDRQGRLYKTTHR